MRRPSSHYIRRVRLRFRFAQVILNALALIAIAGGMAAYFKGTLSFKLHKDKSHNEMDSTGFISGLKKQK